MTTEQPLDGVATKAVEVARELALVSDLFHKVNRVLPPDQKLFTLAPDMSAREAVSLLRKLRFSQAPVTEADTVLGVFSFRSFALRAAELEIRELSQQKLAPGDLTVDDCMEQFDFARVTDDMQQVFDAMDRDNGVLVGAAEKLQGILTPMDFLRYLYRVASPFVMLSEIELTLRALIRLVLSNDAFAACADRSLQQLYGTADKVPKTLEAMTFDNYRQLITHGDNWPVFEPMLGRSRYRVGAKLREIGEIRNDLFHFKREISLADHEKLQEHREWLLMITKKAELRGFYGMPPHDA